MHTTLNPQAIASPAYIVASLENLNEVSADFFCPIKKCFEFACEANFRKSTIPEYKREYEDIENRYQYKAGLNMPEVIVHSCHEIKSSSQNFELFIILMV